jgi:hypothetical protein
VADGLTAISLLEGLLTCVVAIAWYFFLPDFPEEATFLTPEERIIVRRRLAADVGNSAHHVKYTWRDTLGVFRDCKFSSSYHVSTAISDPWDRRQNLPRRLYVLRAHRPRLQLRLLRALHHPELRVRTY